MLRLGKLGHIAANAAIGVGLVEIEFEGFVEVLEPSVKNCRGCHIVGRCFGGIF